MACIHVSLLMFLRQFPVGSFDVPRLIFLLWSPVVSSLFLFHCRVVGVHVPVLAVLFVPGGQYSHSSVCLLTVILNGQYLCSVIGVFGVFVFRYWYIGVLGAGIACWLERRTCDRKVASSNPCRSGGNFFFFSRVNFVC